MTSKELVRKTMKGENPGRTPLYGWVRSNLEEPITQQFGSVEAFEDHYAFDMAHIFGGPTSFSPEVGALKASGVEITPEVLLSYPLNDPDRMEDYQSIIDEMRHHHERGRFCYVQTNGIFECLNGPFDIENHLLYLALYPDELKEVYARQAAWNSRFAEHIIELGADGVHISDDWGSQQTLMFSQKMFREMIVPYHKMVAETVKKYDDVLLSLHSDGCITPALDDVVEIGYDFIHPWQENAHMPYSLYLERYQDRFGLLGGICIQSTLGFGDYDRLEKEIRRVFSILKGKRWACCTTHYVQAHCSMEELVFCFDLARKLADA